jgi:hypothetical protein
MLCSKMLKTNLPKRRNDVEPHAAFIGMVGAWPRMRTNHFLEQERQQWLQERYRFEVAVRVNKRIGAKPEELAPLVSQLERCEKALDAFAEEIRALEGAQAAAP